MLIASSLPSSSRLGRDLERLAVRPVSASSGPGCSAPPRPPQLGQLACLGQAVAQVGLGRGRVPARAASMPSTLRACAVAPRSAAARAQDSAARPNSVACSASPRRYATTARSASARARARLGCGDQLRDHGEMRLGQVPVAQPVVHVGQLVLDAGLHGTVADPSTGPSPPSAPSAAAVPSPAPARAAAVSNSASTSRYRPSTTSTSPRAIRAGSCGM